MKKVLVIRFSSIGDIVLTTPVVRCLKKQLPGIEIHYCTKKQYAGILATNPYINKVHVLEGNLSELFKHLRAGNFDFIVDLHNSLRSNLLRLRLNIPSATFPKLNFRKWLLVNFRINRLPELHIVERYFMATRRLKIVNDQQELDFFIPESDTFDPAWLPETHQKPYIGFVIGGRHATKILPASKVIEVCSFLHHPVVLLGGKEDVPVAEIIVKAFPEKIFNACGRFSLNRSAALIKQAGMIITNDTGLMHIAAALSKRTISIWGSTTPDFGMYPWLPKQTISDSIFFEVENLKCRPCSKIGFDRCPKKHFKCMNLQDSAAIAEKANIMMDT